MTRYIRQLWNGELPLSRVFWNDMLVVGTIVNIAALLAAVGLWVAGIPAWLGFAVHLLPVPYNMLLFAGVSRSAAREQPQWSWIASSIAGLWFVVMLFA
jgi:hypothetical protein